MKILTIIIFYLIVVSSSAQELDGKWLMIKGGDTYLLPENLILEINSDSLTYYSFDKIQSSIPIKIQGKEIRINNRHNENFEFINDNRIAIESSGKVNGKDSLIVTEYVRLVETRTRLTQGEIENLSFELNYNNSRFKVVFNTELEDHQILSIMEKDEITRIQLEKIDATFFISIYEFGKRETVIPIKEVSRDQLVLYGMPGKPYEITGEKIK